MYCIIIQRRILIAELFITITYKVVCYSESRPSALGPPPLFTARNTFVSCPSTDNRTRWHPFVLRQQTNSYIKPTLSTRQQTTMDPTIRRTKNLFLRCMAAVYLSAFSSFYLQIRGRVNSHKWCLLLLYKVIVCRIVWTDRCSSFSCSFELGWQSALFWKILGKSNTSAFSTISWTSCFLLYGTVYSHWDDLLIRRVSLLFSSILLEKITNLIV